MMVQKIDFYIKNNDLRNKIVKKQMKKLIKIIYMKSNFTNSKTK